VERRAEESRGEEEGRTDDDEADSTYRLYCVMSTNRPFIASIASAPPLSTKLPSQSATRTLLSGFMCPKIPLLPCSPTRIFLVHPSSSATPPSTASHRPVYMF
jgi:hypothetical protein